MGKFVGTLSMMACFAVFAGLPQSAGAAPRQMENLTRGLTVANVGSGVLVSWRLLGTEAPDTEFNLYRDGEKIASNVTETNYVVYMETETSGAMYYVTGVQGEVESSPSNKVYYGNYGVNHYLDEVIEVFPNPANETATVTAPGLNSIVLYNILGQEVLKAIANNGTCNLELSGLQKGVYLIKAYTSLGNSIQKLILK